MPTKNDIKRLHIIEAVSSCMGVPGIFRTLTRKYPNIIQPFEGSGLVVDALFVDANSMIHPCAHEVLKTLKGTDGKPEEEIADLIVNKFCEYLNNLCDLVNPTQLLYVAIDGPAPRAKIHQQRQRRYKASKVRRISDQTYLDLGLDSHVSKFDTNAITPGTSFMSILTTRIKAYFKRRPAKCKVLFSSANIVGEGEHKIMAHIREGKDLHKPKHIFVYGLDADLIFLCLSLQLPNLHLVRERIYFTDSPPPESENVIFDLLSIDELTTAFEEDSKIRTRCSFDRSRVIADYVFVCFLLGNDFLPHIPSVNIHSGGHETIQKHYYAVLRNSDKHLVLHDGTVNKKFLRSFLLSLSGEEEKLLTEQTLRRQHFRYTAQFQPNPDKTDSENKHDKKMFDYDVVFKTQPDVIGFGRKGWKWRYYSTYYGLNPLCRPQEYDEFRREIAREYFSGLMWNLAYYKGNLTDYRWFYPYDIAPTLSDLVEFFGEIDTITPKKSKPFKPFEQLLMVLPRDSVELLPKSYRSLLIDKDSALAHLYPIDFSVYTMDKIHYSETIPRLPHIEDTEVALCTKNLRLTAAEKERNVIQRTEIAL